MLENEKDNEIQILESALRILGGWARESGFGFHCIPKEYEEYFEVANELEYLDALAYIAKQEAKRERNEQYKWEIPSHSI